MNNYINYFNHILTIPAFFHRCFEQDLPDKNAQGIGNWQSQATRIALISLPFLSLYKPVGFAISTSMGTCRVITHLTAAYKTGRQGEKITCSIALAKAAFSGMSIAVVFFNFTLGQCITTSVDATANFIHACNHLYNGQYDEGVEELLQATTAAFYVAVILKGTLEVMLIVSLLQAATCLYQAVREYDQEQYLEVGAKILLMIIRLKQANTYRHTIQRRNQLLSIPKYSQLSARGHNGRVARHLLHSSLANLNKQIAEKGVVLSDAKGKKYDFGAHFHRFGKGLVKGNNLTFRTKMVDGKELNELDFKINHLFRSKMEKWIEEVRKVDPQEAREVLLLAGSHAKDIKIEETLFPVGSHQIGPAYKVTIEGLGTIQIGASPTYHNSHTRVIVQIDKNKNLFDLHELISFMDLDEALHVSNEEDISRLKMGHLFRNFFPREATKLERTEPFFTLPVHQLKAEIIRQAPEMKGILDTYFDKMKEHEILPGRVRYSMPGLAERAHQLGARALIASVTGAYSDNEIFDRIASILKMGMLSSDTRYTNNMNVQGASSDFDFMTGGADSVFTQMLTEKDIKDEMYLDELAYYNTVQVRISLKALENGSYQYHEDSYGERRIDDLFMAGDYLARPGIEEFIQEQQTAPFVYEDHEVMLKERVAPSLIEGLIVPDTQTRNDLIDYLRAHNLIKTNSVGTETINQRELDQFIRVGTQVTKQLIDIPKWDAFSNNF